MDIGTPIQTELLLKEIMSWIKNASDQGIPDPNAMCLSTVNPELQPSSRMVLLKGFEKNGLAFYTNYLSPKSADIEKNPKVALNFFWAPLGKQICILGQAEKLSRKHAEDYFRTRPRESQIGAWASHQSEKIQSRDELLSRVKYYEEKFKNSEVPCPPHWGGFTIHPIEIEFWIGMPGRLHERWVFKRSSPQSADWVKFLLSP
jgi:pyridoxamine 5'-phosphate oxidase